MYEKWFRVEVSGAENLPVEGGALLVANHAGAIPIDALMTDRRPRQPPNGRFLRILAADMAFDSPVISEVARRIGATLACASDAEHLLRDGELTAVAGGLQGHRQDVQGPLQVAALRARRLCHDGDPHQRANHPRVDRGFRGDHPMLGDLKPVAWYSASRTSR